MAGQRLDTLLRASFQQSYTLRQPGTQAPSSVTV